MYTIYHNPRCKKSRAGLAFLEAKGLEIEIVKYLDEGLDKDELTNLFKKLGKKPEEMVRKQEAYFKSELKGKTLSDEQWIAEFVQNPKLLHRPIIVKGEKATWGDPPENINQIL